MVANVLVTGEALIDFVPDRSGSLDSVPRFERRPGGAPANVAVALARLDHAPLFWTRLGNDPFGRLLRRTLETEGVPDRFVETDPDAHTTLAFLERGEDGGREFTFYREDTADTRLEPGRIDDSTLVDLSWVHAGGVALSTGRSREATLDLLERAADRGCTVSFDPNDRAALWSDGEVRRRIVREGVAFVDVLKATPAELESLGLEGSDAAELARGALALGPSTVFVTRGEDGAVAVAETGGSLETAAHPGYDVEDVDPTGAGDAFAAGAIVAASGGRDLEGTLSFACAVAAAATTETGAMAALPGRETVRRLERKR